MPIRTALALGILTLVGCTKSTAPSTAQEAPIMTSTPTEQVRALLTSIETGDQAAAAVIDPNTYIQHNLAVADGLAGFGAVLAALPEGSAKARVKRVFQDGDIVFAHTEYDFFGPKAGFDVFRFDEGRIVEHWDNLQTIAGPTPSGHTMFDGPTQASDLDQTEANKALVKRFVQTVLVDGQFDQLPAFFDGNTYTQHNPAIGDGLDGLQAGLGAMAEQGITMEFHTVHAVFGQGDFVLTISEGTFGGEPTSFYDLFRVENGKIAEHWDTIETIAPASEHKNTNGKFGF